MNLTFRKCELTDLDCLVEISRQTFIDAFKYHNDPKDFKSYIDYAFDSQNVNQQLENPNSAFYFAHSNNSLAGYFKLNTGEAQTDIKLPEVIELERIYVMKQYQGQQIGKRMLQEAIKFADQQNKEYLWLGVWQKNLKAIRFYEKQGFKKFGTHPYFIGNDKQTDWLMRYDLINLSEDVKK